jgi:glycosyltransferase involved in cell wall biosynthesis
MDITEIGPANGEKIAVIIPVYNAEKTIGRCLDSLARQTYRNLEVLAVDDASRDKSAEIIRTWAASDGRFRFLEKPNGGAAQARNYALDRLGKDISFVAFLDSDDWMEDDALEALHRLITETGADLAECSFRYEYENGSGYAPAPLFPDGSVFERAELKKTVIPKILTTVNLNQVWHALFRADAIGDLRMPEAMKTGEDLMFILDVLGKARRFAYTERALFHYFRHIHSITGAGLPLSERLRDNFMISEKISASLKLWDMDTPYNRLRAYFRLVVISLSKIGRALKNRTMSSR